MNNEQLKDYIDNELKDIYKIMEDRARDYVIDTDVINNDALLSLYCDEYPVCDYEQEDMSNHSFDLGRYYAFLEIKKQL